MFILVKQSPHNIQEVILNSDHIECITLEPEEKVEGCAIQTNTGGVYHAPQWKTLEEAFKELNQAFAVAIYNA